MSAIQTLRQAMAGKQAEMEARYSEPRRFAELYIDADAMWKVATEFVDMAKDINNISTSNVKAASYNAVDLLEVKGYAKQQNPADIVPPDIVQWALPRLVAPYAWLTAVAGPVFERQETINKAADAIKNAPGNALNWSLKQVLAALGMPSWVLPVVGTVALTGAAWWGYNAFLAPVGRSARLLRKVRA